jgi:hypothetical protein
MFSCPARQAMCKAVSPVAGSAMLTNKPGWSSSARTVLMSPPRVAMCSG